MARTLARVAASIAQQVVRDELDARDLSASRSVAQEAVEAVLLSARHIARAACIPTISRWSNRARPMPSLARGAAWSATRASNAAAAASSPTSAPIDARIGARWAHASASIGVETPWTDERRTARRRSGDSR